MLVFYHPEKDEIRLYSLDLRCWLDASDLRILYKFGVDLEEAISCGYELVGDL